MPGNELAVVGLLAKVEVEVDSVLQKMHHAIAAHDENRHQPQTEAQALRRHLDQRGGHKEARAQRQKVAQIAFDDQDQPPSHIGQGGYCAENERALLHWLIPLRLS